jgi:hypothetical protein
LLHPQEARVERSLVKLQEISADLFDAACDPISMERTQRLQSPQHEEDKSTLEHICPFGWFVLHLETYRMLTDFSVGNQQKNGGVPPASRLPALRKTTFETLRLALPSFWPASRWFSSGMCYSHDHS